MREIVVKLVESHGHKVERNITGTDKNDAPNPHIHFDRHSIYFLERKVLFCSWNNSLQTGDDHMYVPVLYSDPNLFDEIWRFLASWEKCDA